MSYANVRFKRSNCFDPTPIIPCCIPSFVEKFINEDVDIRTKSGDVIRGIITNVNQDECYICIVVPELISPFVASKLIVLDGNQVESISALVDGDTTCI